jgi:hypothetical protein
MSTAGLVRMIQLAALTMSGRDDLESDLHIRCLSFRPEHGTAAHFAG